MTSRSLALVVAVLLLALPAIAEGAEFVDPAGDLHVTLDPLRGEQLCIVIPAGRVDPVACEGYDTAAFAEMQKQTAKQLVILGLAFVNDASGEVRFMLFRHPTISGAAFDLKIDGKAIADGVVETIAPPGATVLRHVHVVRSIAGKDVLQVDTEIEMPAGSPNAPAVYARHLVFHSGAALYGTVFIGAAKDAAKINALGERVLATLRVPTPLPAPSGALPSPPRELDRDAERVAPGAGEPPRAPPSSGERDTSIAVKVGYVFGVVSVIAVIGLTLLSILRRKRPPAEPPPPPLARGAAWSEIEPPRAPKPAPVDDSEWWPKPPKDGPGGS